MNISEANFLIDLFGAIIIFSVGLYIFLRGEKRELNRAFFLMTISAGIWGLGNGLWKLFGISNYHSWEYFRFSWVGIALLAPSFFHTAIILFQKKRKIPLWLLYLPSLITLVFIFTPYFLILNPSPEKETLFIVLPLFRKGFTFSFLVYLFSGEALLILKYFSLRSKEEKDKIKYYFWGSVIPIIVAGLTNVIIPLKGIYSQSPYGFLSFILGFGLAGYGVTKKRLIVDYQDILELLFRRLSELVLVLDSNGVVILMGGHSFLELGYKRSEVENHYLFKILAGGKKKQERIWAKLEKEGEIKEEKVQFLAKNKKKKTFSIDVFRFKDKIVIIGKDIGEFLKESEELEKKVRERTKDLEESQAALMNILEDVEEAHKQAVEERDKTLAIFNNFADGLIVLDKNAVITMVNPQGEAMLGIKKEKVIGKKIEEMKKFLGAEALQLIFKNGKVEEVKRKEFSPQKDKTLEITTVSLKGIGWLIIFHDISREKIIEKLKTEFVSVSAHQLRTPLSAIKWSLKMLLDGDVGKITAEQKEFLEKTYWSNERMINLVNDLLDVARIEEGRFLYKPETISLEDLVDSLVKPFKRRIEKKNIKFEVKKPRKKIPKVKVDSEKIGLAISNLIDNAIRYTKEGGRIIIKLGGDKKKVEFSISDSGIGIPKSQQARIFTKFFRGTNAVKTQTEGTGLGLFITKNIIEAHGGKIWFKSEEGKGTTFYFVLPAQKE